MEMVRALIAAGIILFDQLTKYWAAARLQGGGEIVVIPAFLRFFYTENRGAAFSLFAELASAQTFLTLASIVGTIIFLVLLYRHQHSRTWTTSLILLLAGTVGNLIDRVRLGYVIDFIAVNFGSYQFPIFNIADSAIVIGVSLMLVDLVLEARNPGPSDA